MSICAGTRLGRVPDSLEALDGVYGRYIGGGSGKRSRQRRLHEGAEIVQNELKKA